MRVVFVTDLFQPEMGYATVRLPVAMAKVQGVEVHVVTSGFHSPVQSLSESDRQLEMEKCKERAGSVSSFEGVNIHFLDSSLTANTGMKMLGLRKKFQELNPDIVQVFVHMGWSAIDGARLKKILNYKLFTGNHTTASVFPLCLNPKPFFHPRRFKEWLRRGLPGRFISSQTEICYGATIDCSYVAQNFLGVPAKKIKTVPLGVDTVYFHPAATDSEHKNAFELRSRLGVDAEEIMCVYTGKFTPDKNPLLLAQAVQALRQKGEPFRAVFFGDGAQLAEMLAVPDVIVHPFVHFSELGHLFRAADIGVWPTQESTSMIDCAACGTPIIVNDKLAAVERVEGNGLQYILGDVDDLAAKLLELRDPARRRELGDFGARKIEEQFSWNALVQIRIDDYRAALGNAKSRS